MISRGTRGGPYRQTWLVTSVTTFRKVNLSISHRSKNKEWSFLKNWWNVLLRFLWQSESFLRLVFLRFCISSWRFVGKSCFLGLDRFQWLRDLKCVIKMIKFWFCSHAVYAQSVVAKTIREALECVQGAIDTTVLCTMSDLRIPIFHLYDCVFSHATAK